MEGLGWEDSQPLFNQNSKQGVYATDIEDNHMVYWFPTLMKGEMNENKDELEDIIG